MRTKEEILKKRNEREINITDMMWSVVYAWRQFLLGAVVCAVVIAGFKYVLDKRNYEEEIQQQNSMMSQEGTKIEDVDIKAVEDVLAREQQIEKKTDYLLNSIYMSLESSAVNKVSIIYYVEIDDRTGADGGRLQKAPVSFVNAYIAYIQNGGIQNALKEAMGQQTEAIYLSELVSVNEVTSDENCQFVITVVGKDEVQVTELADKVSELVEAYQSRVEEQVGNHRLIVADRYSYIEADSTIQEEQTTQKELVQKLQKDLETQVAALSAEQKELYTYALMPENDERAKPATPEFSIKYLMLGCFAGIFLIFVWTILRYILSTKIHQIVELRDLYGVRVFGTLQLENNKKRFLGVVDRWLDSLHKKDKLLLKEQRNLILSNIYITCKKEDIQAITFASGLHLNEEEKGVIDDIVCKLKQKGVSAAYRADIAQDATALEAVVEIGQVILIEKVNMSKYSAVEEEFIFCVEHDMNVLGMIGLE